MHNVTYTVTFFYFVFGLGAPLSGAFLGATSAALGLFLSAATTLIFTFRYSTFFPKFRYKNFNLFLSLIFYFLFQQLILGHFQLKSYGSLLLLLFLLHASKALATKLISLDFEDHILYFLKLTSVLFVSVVAFNYQYDFQFAEGIYEANRAVFPFGEPSHFALYAGPIFVLLGFSYKTSIKRLAVLFLIIAIGFILKSLTFFVYGILFAILMLFKRVSLTSIFSFIIAFILIYFSLIGDVHLLEKIDISSDSSNLSALVYLQGLQDAWNSLIISFGLGIGYQMLGTQPPSDASYLISAILDVPAESAINRFDGGFLAAKIVAEFGILGIILLLIYVRKIIQSLVYLSGIRRDSSVNFNIACHVFLYCSIVEFFVRGIGYFSPSLFILALLCFLSSIGRTLKENVNVSG